MFEHKPTARLDRRRGLPVRRRGPPDGALKRAVTAAVEAGMPPIEVAPNAGKLLKLLVQLSGARRVLEIGTLAGFSTIWMAQGLPDDGRLVTCEYLAKHAEVARANVDAAGRGPQGGHPGRVPHWTRSARRGGRRRSPSISSSSMRTRKTTRTTSTGPSALAGRAPPS